MSREEVKASIRSQILIVFFLPLVTATIHVLFAYPVIERLLRMVQLDNRMLFIGCIFGCVLNIRHFIRMRLCNYVQSIL